MANAYPFECNRVQQDLSVAQAQLRDYQARLGKPFQHDAYLSELTNLRDQLKAALSSTANNADKDAGPSVSELAERINGLKAVNNIEGLPQRVRQKHSSAEEPVTARVRRRTETAPPDDPQQKADTPSSVAVAKQTHFPAVLSQQPVKNFQNLLSVQRKHENDGPTSR